jgi:hypothetical protein
MDLGGGLHLLLFRLEFIEIHQLPIEREGNIAGQPEAALWRIGCNRWLQGFFYSPFPRKTLGIYFFFISLPSACRNIRNKYATL